MMILLLLLSLCATDCRIAPDSTVCHPYVGGCYQMCYSYYHDGQTKWIRAVVEKCDTVWCRTYEFGDKFTAVYRVYVECHPETTLVDSGVVEDGWWFSVPDGSVDVRKDETDTLWIFDTPFLRSEMPDLKEMLREWREKRREEAIWRCVRDYQYRAMTDWSLQMTGDQLEDSCRCVYGGQKK